MAIQWSGLQWLRHAGGKAARASLIVFLCQLCVGHSIAKWRPEWHCSAIEPGGKELICGRGYGLPLLDTANEVALWIWIALYVLGVATYLSGWATRKDKLILLILSCVLVLFGVAAITFGAEDTP